MKMHDGRIMDMQSLPVEVELEFKTYRSIGTLIGAAISPRRLLLQTGAGLKIANEGDYIVKDVDGQLNAHPPDAFKALYKLPAEDTDE